MSDVAFALPAVVPPRRLLRTAVEWLLLGLLTVLLGSIWVVAMVACGCSLDFALGMIVGNISHGRRSGPDNANRGKDNERERRLGSALRRRLGLDALTRHRVMRRQERAERNEAVRMRLERRRHDKALRRAEIARRMGYKLRQALLWLFAGIGVLTVVTVLVAAVLR